MKVTEKRLETPNHINRFLTHWTGREKTDEVAFNNLTKIVESFKLKFSDCVTTYPEAAFTSVNKMICFTDTPIDQSLNHCKRYNYFGISFNKEMLIEYGANPVLYIVNNRRSYSEFMETYFQLKRPNNNEESNLLSWVRSCFQPYDTKLYYDKDWAEFYEREWRIIRIQPFHWLEYSETILGKNNEYPFKGKIHRVQKSDNVNDEEFYLQFDKNIIENIIIPSDFDREKVKELMRQNNLDCELIIIER